MDRSDLNYCSQKLGDAVELLVLGFRPGIESLRNMILKKRVLMAWGEAKHVERFLPKELQPRFQKLLVQATSEPAITEEEGETIQSIGTMTDEELTEFARGILALFEVVIEMGGYGEGWD